MIRRPPRSTPKPSSAASDVYKRQAFAWRADTNPAASTTQAMHKLRVHSSCPFAARSSLAQVWTLPRRCQPMLVRSIGARLLSSARRATTMMSTMATTIKMMMAMATRMMMTVCYLQPGQMLRGAITCLLPQTMNIGCLLYTSPSPRDRTRSRMPSSA